MKFVGIYISFTKAIIIIIEKLNDYFVRHVNGIIIINIKML